MFTVRGRFGGQNCSVEWRDNYSVVALPQRFAEVWVEDFQNRRRVCEEVPSQWNDPVAVCWTAWGLLHDATVEGEVPGLAELLASDPDTDGTDETE